MKAITIKQPWATLIMRGGKDIENREWPARYRGVIAITAACRLHESDIYAAARFIGGFTPNFSAAVFSKEAYNYPRGCVLGTARIVGCVTKSDSPWFTGPYGFVLADPRPLAQPIPCLGKLGIWDLPEDIEKRVMEGLK